MKASTYKMPGIGAFGDDMRDAIRGPFSDDTRPAYLAALPGNEESIKFGIVGAISHPDIDMSKVNYSKAAWTAQPTQHVSYVSCHDDMSLVDRLRTSFPGISTDELIRLDKLAQTFVLTSQGIPFLWAGEEVLRDKKGVHNSYNSPGTVCAYTPSSSSTTKASSRCAPPTKPSAWPMPTLCANISTSSPLPHASSPSRSTVQPSTTHGKTSSAS